MGILIWMTQRSMVRERLQTEVSCASPEEASALIYESDRVKIRPLSTNLHDV